jgi:hypothetical protein
MGEEGPPGHPNQWFDDDKILERLDTRIESMWSTDTARVARIVWDPEETPLTPATRGENRIG